MFNPISNQIDNVWESWSIRAVMLFSLSLQIFLTICSPLRKRTSSAYIRMFIWSAYLMADSAAIFCVGHIASSQISSNKIKINSQNHLLALWAPFLMVHLGGPDTITAFSLEDNQLWLRHMSGFITQFLFCAYVFLLTVPGNRLWIPIVLVFVAGIIKYVERIYSLYDASIHVNGLSLNILFYNLVTKIISRFEREEVEHEPRSHDPRFNLRVIEIFLSMYYDRYFTKFTLSYGYLSRFVTISCLLTALGLFLFEEKQYKQGFNPFDIKVTYTLMCGAVALDIIALFMQFFSDRGFVNFPTLVDFSFMKSILQFKRTRWSKCKKKPYTKFTQLSTLLPFRKWKESISGFNIISYNRYMMRKQSSSLHYFNRFSGGRIFMWLNEVKNPFLLELWDFIVTEYQDGIVSHRPSVSPSKCLTVSDYMMYLLVLKTDVIPNAQSSDIEMILDVVQDNLKPYFINGDEDEVEACKRFVAENAQDVETNSHQFYLFNNVRMLAKELGMISEASIKWEIISRVWVQLLYIVAFDGSFSIYVKHLCKGGELIWFFWALLHTPSTRD